MSERERDRAAARPDPYGKKKHAVWRCEGRGAPRPTPRKRGFLKKAPFETEKHMHQLSLSQHLSVRAVENILTSREFFAYPVKGCIFYIRVQLKAMSPNVKQLRFIALKR